MPHGARSSPLSSRPERSGAEGPAVPSTSDRCEPCQLSTQWFIISELMRLDSHQHFWHYSPTEHTWMTDQMAILKRAFLPQDLQPLLASIHFDGCVSVQARQNLEETRWLLELADQYDFIKGVVGWGDLCSKDS